MKNRTGNSSQKSGGGQRKHEGAMLVWLLFLVCVVVTAEEKAAKCTYYLVTGKRKTQRLRETMGYYFKRSKEHLGSTVYTQIESLTETCNKKSKTCSKRPQGAAYIFGDDTKGLWMIGQIV